MLLIKLSFYFRPPFIQIVPIDPLLKVNYLNTGPGGSIQPSDTCFNSSAVYVTCPDFLCGTRVSSTSQLLREVTTSFLFITQHYCFREGRPIIFVSECSSRKQSFWSQQTVLTSGIFGTPI